MVPLRLRHLSYSCHVDDAVPTMVVSDAGKIKQVALNLLENAIKYNVENGSIYFKVARVPEGLCISVGDTGQGMTHEKMQQIFTCDQPFSDSRLDEAETKRWSEHQHQSQDETRDKAKSKGKLQSRSAAVSEDEAEGKGDDEGEGRISVSLPVSKAICRLLGGELRAESRLGRESRFIFLVHLHDVPSEPAPETAKQPSDSPPHQDPNSGLTPVSNPAIALKQNVGPEEAKLGAQTVRGIEAECDIDPAEIATPKARVPREAPTKPHKNSQSMTMVLPQDVLTRLSSTPRSRHLSSTNKKRVAQRSKFGTICLKTGSKRRQRRPQQRCCDGPKTDERQDPGSEVPSDGLHGAQRKQEPI
jgi:hypothetical protein